MVPVRRHAPQRPQVRWDRQRAWAASIFCVGLLLFVWPFARSPPLTLGESTLHLLGAWAAVIAALFLMARALGRGGRGSGAPDA